MQRILLYGRDEINKQLPKAVISCDHGMAAFEMGKREMIMKMYSKGYTTAQIADVAEMDEKEIEDMIKNVE